MQFNWTEGAGLLAFGSAAAASLAAAAQARGKAWGVKLIGVTYLFLAAEMVANARHRFGDWARRLLHEAQQYGDRRATQLLVLGAFLIILLVALGLIRKRIPVAQRLVTTICVLSVATFVIESISLHALDTVLYTRVGPFLLIAVIWAALGICAVVAAIAYSRKSSATPHDQKFFKDFKQ